MLGAIQGALSELYDVQVEASVEDFVCDAAVVRATVGAEQVDRGELLVVAEEQEGVSVGLYVDPEAVAALEGRGLDWQEAFEACCLATEGVSHFLYLMFRAESGEPVSQLELELQAEVDKYATGLLAGNGVGAIRARSRSLRRRLFHQARFRDGAETEQGERYRVASRIAERFTRWLEAEHLDRGDLPELGRQLRRFYRMGLREKLERAGGA